jgi:hypothetical protein
MLFLSQNWLKNNMPSFIGVSQGWPGYRKNPFLVSRFSFGPIAANEKRETRNGFSLAAPYRH